MQGFLGFDYEDTYYDDYKLTQPLTVTSGTAVSQSIPFSVNPLATQWNSVIWHQEIGDSIIVVVDKKTSSGWIAFDSSACSAGHGCDTINISRLGVNDTIRLRAKMFIKSSEEPDLFDWAVSWFLFPTNINENIIVPDQFDIMAYPNPFNSSVEFSSIPDANVLILDINGQIVEQFKSCSFIEKWLPKDNITSGIYFLKISDGKKGYVKKLIFMK